MATSTDPEEIRVSCPICFDPYRKPKSLKCGHLLCTPCIEEIMERNQDGLIQCVICRVVSEERDLRRDFTMEDNVEAFLKKQSPNKAMAAEENTSACGVSDDKTTPCDVCMEKQVEYKCIDCDQFLCETCKTIHFRFENSRNHNVTDIDQLMPALKFSIEEFITQMTSSKQKCESAMDDIERYQETVVMKTSEVVAAIKEFSGAVVRKCDDLCDKANQSKESEIQKLNSALKKLKDMESKLGRDINVLQNKLKQNNPSLLKSREYTDLHKTLTEDLKHYDESLTPKQTKKFELRFHKPQNIDKFVSSLDIRSGTVTDTEDKPNGGEQAETENSADTDSLLHRLMVSMLPLPPPHGGPPPHHGAPPHWPPHHGPPPHWPPHHGPPRHGHPRGRGRGRGCGR